MPKLTPISNTRIPSDSFSVECDVSSSGPAFKFLRWPNRSFSDVRPHIGLRMGCMSEQIPLTEESRADSATIDQDNDDNTHEIGDDLAYKRLGIVNVVFYGRPGAGDREWVLIDAGLPGFAGAIQSAAGKRFHKKSRPAAILMTHGHFDHIGAAQTLADEWDAPIYAHALEQPYLDGRSAYPPPDPSVGGGLMALTSPLFPPGPFDVSEHLRILPD